MSKICFLKFKQSSLCILLQTTIAIYPNDIQSISCKNKTKYYSPDLSCITWCKKCVHMSTLCQVATVGWRKITFNCYTIDCNAINTTCFVKWLSSWSMQVKDWRRKVNKLQALAARGLPKNSNTFRELIGGCFRKLVSPDPMCNVSHNLMYHNQWGL